MFKVRSEIVSNYEVGKGIFKLSFFSPQIAGAAKPGQFVHIRCSALLNPLLRRPFSIHYVEGDNVEVLYRVVGGGTALLSERKTGEELNVLGPLGNGFKFTGEDETIIVGGGMGIAPLFFLAKKLAPGRTAVFIGAQTENGVLGESRFRELDCSVKVATEDGSYGKKGMIDSLLREHLSERKSQERARVYACGPQPMLKELAKICSHFHIPCQVSMESQMGCGIGACLGCAVLVRGENGSSFYKRVCRDGPVFRADEVLWN